MTERPPVGVGLITWTDLTVGNAEQVRDFYRAVVGWEFVEFDMGGYSDYCMQVPGTDKTVAGICHARGANAGLPPQWLVYIQVADLNRSMTRCREAGGTVIAGPRQGGTSGRFCVIRDVAGAFAALIEPETGA